MITPTIKRIIICADDYGQAIEISQAILTLIKNRRISATSCLVNTLHWADHAAWLSPFREQIDIGLHFNLTQGCPLSSTWTANKFDGLSKLASDLLLGRINQSMIEAECDAQLTQFTKQMGVLPDFIDGHQHIHQFPVIRDALIKIYLKYLKKTACYLRWVNETIKWSDIFSCFKKFIIVYGGTLPFKKLLDLHAIPHNESFGGIYAFKEDYPQIFKGFLRNIGDKGVIMCHPATKETDELHPIAKARPREYAYLSSEEFIQDCQNLRVYPARFST